MSATWWSESQRRAVPLSEMHDSHLIRAWKKFNRGQYMPGGEPQADPISAGEETELRLAFEAEFARRGITPEGA